MKFPYMKLGPDTYRSIVPFAISFQGGKSIKYFGLVDSGADSTYIAGELAGALGIKDVTTGRMESVMGIGGKSEAYFHSVIINIGGHNFNIEAGFTADSSLTAVGCGLLGQIGLFDHCTIKFSRRKFEIEIIPIQSILNGDNSRQ